jgi:hypothetical protein
MGTYPVVAYFPTYIPILEELLLTQWVTKVKLDIN